MNLAVIPARGGSKRIPGKNIKSFAGKPIMAWVLESARSSGCFDAIIVSTDDDGIAAVAQQYGAETPFRRPPELADDHTGVQPVVAHAATWFGTHRARPDHVCCLFPTAPFIEPSDLSTSLKRLQESGKDYAFSVTSFAYPIQRALRVAGDGGLAMMSPEHIATRSQDLEPAYHDAGQFYWGRTEAWVAGKPVFGAASLAVKIPRLRAQDIDTPEDWTLAEELFRAFRNSPGGGP